MGNYQQVEAVKYALDLEVYIAEHTEKLSELKSEQCRPTPDLPVRNVIQRIYPEINPQLKVDWKIAFLPLIVVVVSMVLSMVGISTQIDVLAKIGSVGSMLLLPSIIWIPVYRFVIHKKKIKAEIERISNTVEYRSQCATMDQNYDQMQAEADWVYQNQQYEYEVAILPRYKLELEEWTRAHNEIIRGVEYNLQTAKMSLDNLYTTTRIIPLQYRQIETIQYIYDTISTSDFDVRYAIELYDKSEQRKLEEARFYQQQEANQLANEQNDLLYEQNEISERARRDANFAALVGTVQHHNTNKILKGRR